AVGETGAEMQQRGRRLALHAEIAVSRPGYHTLEQAEHAAHALDPVERRDEMHLGSTRIGETNVNPACHQRSDQTFRTVHSFHSSSQAALSTPSTINHCSRLSSKGPRALQPSGSELMLVLANVALESALVKKRALPCIATSVQGAADYDV